MEESDGLLRGPAGPPGPMASSALKNSEEQVSTVGWNEAPTVGSFVLFQFYFNMCDGLKGAAERVQTRYCSSQYNHAFMTRIHWPGWDIVVDSGVGDSGFHVQLASPSSWPLVKPSPSESNGQTFVQFWGVHHHRNNLMTYHVYSHHRSLTKLYEICHTAVQSISNFAGITFSAFTCSNLHM